MVTSREKIDQWRASPSEHQQLEFKEAKAQFDLTKAARYSVAIANEGGGNLVLGVSNEAPREVVGTQAFRDPNSTADKLRQILGFRVDIEEVVHPDGRVVVFHIPSRPAGTAYNHEGSYLMRSGENLVPMTEDRLRAIFDEGKEDWLEARSKEDLGPQDIIELLDSQRFYELLKQPYPTTQEGVIERLVAFQLVDVTGDRYAIRRMGALLLARRLADFPDIERKAPRVIAYTGTGKLETRIEQTGGRGYATGFRGLVRYVMDQLPQNEVIEDAIRDKQKLVPEPAIREVVANALIHQDFSIGGSSVFVEIYSNRIEISNPGAPIVPVERFIDGYRSRNERLAKIMRNLRICEEKGSGIDRVVLTAEMFQLPAPDFWADATRTTVTIFGLKPFVEMDGKDRIRACYQHCALKQVMSEYMTNGTLRDRFQLRKGQSGTVSQIIGATIDAGLIKLDDAVGGSRKYARYLPFWA